MDKIRIAYCIDSFSVGGTEMNAVRTAEALDPARFDVCLFHIHEDGPLRERYEALGLHMFHLPISNLYSLQTIAQGFRFARLLRWQCMNLVHTHDLYTNIFCAPWSRVIGRCPVLASRRWWYDAPRPGLGTLNRWSYYFASQVLANSSGVAQLLVGEEGLPRNKVVEIPNFLGESAFHRVGEELRQLQRSAWEVPKEAFIVGIVARLAPVKNHSLLLEAIALLSDDVHAVLVGDGPSKAELQGLARRLSIQSRVHFVGEVTSEVNQHQFFDVSVLCSTSEGFPNSLIEALAVSRPVVATGVGGVTDIVVDGQTGVLVPLAEPAKLAIALDELKANPSRCVQLGAAGLRAVRDRFNQRNVIERLSELYERMAGHLGHVAEASDA